MVRGSCSPQELAAITNGIIAPLTMPKVQSLGEKTKSIKIFFALAQLRANAAM
ncbi:hypothetical protein SAMN05443582_101615 [Phyllobacterium sp. OV277]|jgi:hypothetical protein|nr:hypothetical protein SAMN05443582_101615 [Phyllobacterium sp. OV277]